jgi:hypothetical protein
VRAGDREFVGSDAVERAPARRASLLRIDVEDEPGVGTRNLHRGEVNEIAPNQQALLAGCDQPSGMAGRVAGQRNRRDTGQRFALAHETHAGAIRRGRDRRFGNIATDALALPARLVAIEPELRFRLVQDQLRVRKDGAARVIDETVGMVGMDMGEKDRGDFLRRNAEGA